MKVAEKAERWAHCVLSVLRVVTAMLFIEHCTQKVLGFSLSSNAAPPLWSLLGASGVLELAGGSLVLGSIFPILNGGDADILFSFVFLYFAVAGGGRWSLDHMRNNDRRELRA